MQKDGGGDDTQSAADAAWGLTALGAYVRRQEEEEAEADERDGVWRMRAHCPGGVYTNIVELAGTKKHVVDVTTCVGWGDHLPSCPHVLALRVRFTWTAILFTPALATVFPSLRSIEVRPDGFGVEFPRQEWLPILDALPQLAEIDGFCITNNDQGRACMHWAESARLERIHVVAYENIEGYYPLGAKALRTDAWDNVVIDRLLQNPHLLTITVNGVVVRDTPLCK